MEAPTKGLFVGRDKYRAEADTELQSMQTPVPAALRRIPSQSAHHAQQECDYGTSYEDNDAVQQECSSRCSGMPTRSVSRVVSRVSLRAEIGEKVKIDFRPSVSGMPKRGTQAILCHRHGYLQKCSKQRDVIVSGDLYSPLSRMENSQTCAQYVMRDDDEDVSKRQDGCEDEEVDETPEVLVWRCCLVVSVGFDHVTHCASRSAGSVIGKTQISASAED